MTRTLEVLINDDHVATLSEQNNTWQLAYTPAWQNSPHAFDLAPSLPRAQGTILDGSSERPVQWFFDNLLPEEHARDLLAHDAKLLSNDNFGLLAYYGAESAGAVTLLADPTQPRTSGLAPLPDEILSERIRNLPRVSLAKGAPKRMSLAGAQHKLAVVIKDRALFEPTGNTLSTHILKPDHPSPEHYQHSVANEWFVMNLARAAGLQVPRVEMRRVPEPIYLIERFDRRAVNGEIVREHVLDGCQLLGLDSRFKYQQATMETLQRIIDLVRNKATTRMRLFKWLVFNLVVGNDDSHLKNLSFEVRPDGFDLVPHYDLLCTSIYHLGDTPWLTTGLTWSLEGVPTHADLSVTAILNMGGHLGLTARQSERILRDTLAPLLAEAPRLLKECEAQMTAGENRLLRQIWHGVIRDLSARMTA